MTTDPSLQQRMLETVVDAIDKGVSFAAVEREIATRMANEIDGFAGQVHGLSLLAKAEIDNGDIEGALKTLVRIAEVAHAKLCK